MSSRGDGRPSPAPTYAGSTPGTTAFDPTTESSGEAPATSTLLSTKSEAPCDSSQAVLDGIEVAEFATPPVGNSETPRDNTSPAAMGSVDVAKQATLAGAKVISIRTPCETVLRGVPLDELLRDNCSVLRLEPPTIPSAREKYAKNLWRRSRPLTGVDSWDADSDLPIDYFMSHCWQDGALRKALTLQFFFRWPDVTVNVLVTGVAAASFLLWSGDTQYFPLLLFGCMLVEVCTLLGWAPSCSWLARCGWRQTRRGYRRVHQVLPETASPRHKRQRLETLLCSSTLVFLDRLCIHQSDRQLNGAGILAIGGILRQSSQLLALWSPRYLNRMWCTFELAVFLATRSGKDERQLRMVPLAIGPMWCFLTIALSLVLVVHAMSYTGLAERWSVPLPMVAVMLAATGWLIPFRVCRLLVMALEKARADAARFSIHNTKITEEKDREVLYGTLSQLFTNRFQRGPDGKLVVAPVQLAPEALQAVAHSVVYKGSPMQVFGHLSGSVPAPDPRFLRWDEAVDEIVRERAAHWTDVNQFLNLRYQAPVLAMVCSTTLLMASFAVLESDVSFAACLQMGLCFVASRSVLACCMCFNLFTQLGVTAQSLTAYGCRFSPVWDLLGVFFVVLVSAAVPLVCAMLPTFIFHGEESDDDRVHPAIQYTQIQGGWLEVVVRVFLLVIAVSYTLLLWKVTIARTPAASSTTALPSRHTAH